MKNESLACFFADMAEDMGTVGKIWLWRGAYRLLQ